MRVEKRFKLVCVGSVKGAEGDRPSVHDEREASLESERRSRQPQRKETTRLPCTVEAGSDCKVRGFRQGDRIRLVRVREDLDDIVQLTREDVLAISNIIAYGPDYEPRSETEQVWCIILATLEKFPGSRLLPS